MLVNEYYLRDYDYICILFNVFAMQYFCIIHIYYVANN